MNAASSWRPVVLAIPDKKVCLSADFCKAIDDSAIKWCLFGVILLSNSSDISIFMSVRQVKISASFVLKRC